LAIKVFHRVDVILQSHSQPRLRDEAIRFLAQGICILDSQGPDRNKAFVELLTLHQRRLFGFIYTFVPNPADAEDLLQQTSLVLWQKFADFDLGSDFVAWACRVAHFEVLHFFKQKRRNRVFFNDELITKLAAIRIERTDVHSADRDALWGCVEKLAKNDQRLLKLCYATKRNIKSAAAALGRPATSVYVSLVRIRRGLMECIRQINAKEGGP
jgi:RNA polymerase sigma-70 factor (ECF subfamily)